VKFKVSKERVEALPWELAVALEDFSAGEQPSFRAMRGLAVHFMVGEAGDPKETIGQYLPEKLALKKLAGIPLSGVSSVVKQLGEAMQTGLVPLESDE
jgi:hypothetical protein